MLHVVCTRLHPGHLTVRVGDNSRRSDGIAKKSRIVLFKAIMMMIMFADVSRRVLCRTEEGGLVESGMG